MKIIFICRKFHRVAGGMEKISIAIMNAMVKRGHKVALITWDHDQAEAHYDISEDVEWFKLAQGNPDEKANWRTRILRIGRCRKFIKKFRPNVIIGFQSGGFIFGYVASLFCGVPCVAAERVSPDTWRHVRQRFVERLVDIHALNLASRVTVQFPSYIRHYPFWLRKKISVIPNPIYTQLWNDSYKDDSRVLLNVGRLCGQKNQKFLIRSFKQVSERNPEWKLVLVGDGEDETALFELVKELNLEKKVEFTGAIKDVAQWYKKAGIFLFPSIFEGFPNALSEALSFGLPSIGFAETFGVNELIISGKNGLLTGSNEQEFAEAINKLIENPDARKEMSLSARKSVKQYEPEKVFEKWESFFKEYFE